MKPFTVGDLMEKLSKLPRDRPLKILIHLGRDPISGKSLVIEDDDLIVVNETAVCSQLGAAIFGISEVGKQ